MIRTRPGVAAVVSLLLLGAACSGDDSPDLSVPDDTIAGVDDARTDATAEDPLLGETFHVAQGATDPLVVRTSAQASAEEMVSLSAADETSGLVVCLVDQQIGDWLEVHLPSGPTDRTGWVARDDVTLSRHRFRIVVSRSERTMTLYTGEVVALTAPVGFGPDAPPTGGDLYIKELVRPPDPAGPYGAYAYGLSGADNERHEFAAGAGVVALHGTSDPGALGGDVPRGAIAIDDEIVTRLVDTIGLPLGTPIEITG